MLFFLAIVFIFVAQVQAANFVGKVVKVSDGDTIEVMHQGRAERIRLAEIDCPEKKQPFGKKAKEFTIEMAAGKIVTVEIETKDRYGQTVGEVILSDGRSLNRELVKAGMAWWYRTYSKDESIGALESDARRLRIGLWQDISPSPPWEYRKGKRTARKLISSEFSNSRALHGNSSSKVFHQKGCKYYDCKNCSENFANRNEAIGSGFKPCGICKP